VSRAAKRARAGLDDGLGLVSLGLGGAVDVEVDEDDELTVGGTAHGWSLGDGREGGWAGFQLYSLVVVLFSCS
jgi:hypothetical protein